ncbi:ATP-binding protein [Nonomuraea roseoviolacea]|uniref:Anti-anti-sigma factor n=1 Tax=Nonomuraea roseoviolacea subsp. carminata TaxID=160689 RepID=A0ABT1K8S4_9ACTN|nr:ATP-binding protein [Nonomuraea roseoviolacea]MCP2350405.1 anti-anti-sigma factor [Nonomuraea roseoviolacea subsp. carminata]
MVDDASVNTPTAAQDERRLILDQAFDADLLYALRATLEAHATHAGMPDGRAMDLVITVHELATNAVVHGAGTGRVRIWRTGDTLRCEISDAGRATPPAAAPGTVPENDVVVDAARWPVEHGHGLWIARFLPDRFTIGSGPEGTVAVADFALPPDGHDEPFALTRHDLDSHTVLELSGALGDEAAQQLAVVVREIVSAGPEPRLLLDLGRVTFWDVMGIAALITAQQQVDGAKAGAMVLTGLTADFRRRLDALSPAPLTVAGTQEEAVRRLQPPA